ncbi:SIMPL domain-containing protein [Hirschia maritima]|uniref:SIMPL domain-containing protein n=1 Tax=Hirschia maritima TaxID=1121961 RepID=UPI00035E7AC8|nr:SIMPL domain-containing protein [Hirschia maritima]
MTRKLKPKSKFATVLSAAILSTACTSLPLHAQAQSGASQQTMPTIQQETTLNLTGHGKIEVAPDIATISLGVNVEAETAADTMKKQANLMNGVFNALKKAGIENKDMQTGNISLSPRYDYSSRKNGPPKLIGYQASNTVGITVREINSLGSILDAVVNAGGNTINSISFGLDDSSEALKSARKAAVKDALSKAELYADAAGYKVARIISMNESGNYSPGPQPVMMARMEMADSASTPIAAGEVSYSSTMNVQFELVKK